MIYVDTNVLVSFINPSDPLHKRASELLSGHDELVVSKFVVVELYSVYSRTMSLSDIELEAIVQYTLRKANVQVINVDWDKLIAKASSYANKLKLKTLDLLHVTASYLIGANSIITFDKDIKKKADTIQKELQITVIS